MSQEEEKEKSKGKKKEKIVVKITLLGRKYVIEVPKGTKIRDAIKEAGINEDLNKLKVSLDGNLLKKDENPALEKNATITIAAQVSGGPFFKQPTSE